MTKEELEKEAKEYWWDDNNCSGASTTEKIYECGYLAGAEPREKRINELEALIEKMKCCGNCRFGYCKTSSEYTDKDGNRIFHCWNEEKENYCDVGNGECEKYQLWEIKEK